MGSFSIWHWLVVLAIVVLVFGTKKLRNLGGDLGAAIKNFKGSVKDGETDINASKDAAELTAEQKTANAESREKTQV